MWGPDDGVDEVGTTASFAGAWEESLFLRDDLATMTQMIRLLVFNEKRVFLIIEAAVIFKKARIRLVYETNWAMMAFCTWSRFSAWRKIVSAWASKVSSSISLPR